MALAIQKHGQGYWKVDPDSTQLDLDNGWLEISLNGYTDGAARRAGLQPSASVTVQRPVSDEMLDRMAGGDLSLTDAAYELLHTSHPVDAGDPENPVEANDWLGAEDLITDQTEIIDQG